MKKQKKAARPAAKKAKAKTKPATRKTAKHASAKPAPKVKAVEPRVSEIGNPDPAHRPGHRTINVEANFSGKKGAKVHLQDSAVNRMSRSDKIKRTSRTNRRIISGAAVGKTGRIVTEKV